MRGTILEPKSFKKTLETVSNFNLPKLMCHTVIRGVKGLHYTPIKRRCTQVWPLFLRIPISCWVCVPHFSLDIITMGPHAHRICGSDEPGNYILPKADPIFLPWMKITVTVVVAVDQKTVM